MEVSGQIHPSAALALGKEPQYPPNKETEWGSEPVWRLEKRKLSVPYWESNRSSTAVQPICQH
jgi:hypothetical protein